ncbi:hypothetical protein CEXT_470911, partial [Caerostris extrusa]
LLSNDYISPIHLLPLPLTLDVRWYHVFPNSSDASGEFFGRGDE